MKTTRILVVIVYMMTITNFALSDIIRGIDIDFVTIGNAGNAGDTGGEVGLGAVSYDYRIGKYEVTNAQWNSFTSAAGIPLGEPNNAYNNSSSWTGTNVPTTNVSWYEGLQFCNYLTSGDKSKGAYLFSGNNSNPEYFLGIDRNLAISVYGTIYVIPTQDEWYKAAYFKPDGSGYSLFANGTDTAPIAGVQSNYWGAIGVPWNVGTGTEEQNGTFDIMGNVWEWNETLIRTSDRGVRGGSYGEDAANMIASYALGVNPCSEWNNLGFRVAEVPEPASALLIICGAGLLRLQSKKRQIIKVS